MIVLEAGSIVTNTPSTITMGLFELQRSFAMRATNSPSEALLRISSIKSPAATLT